MQFGFIPVISGGNLFNVANTCSSWKLSSEAWVERPLLSCFGESSFPFTELSAGRSAIKNSMSYLKWNTSNLLKWNSFSWFTHGSLHGDKEHECRIYSSNIWSCRMHEPLCWTGFSCRSENLLSARLGGFSNKSASLLLIRKRDVGTMKDFFLEMMLMAQQDYLRSFSNIIKVSVLWNKTRRLMWLWVSQKTGALLVYCTQFSDSQTFHRVQKCGFFF